MKNLALKTILVCLAGALLITVLVWQAITVAGNPDPTARGISPIAGILDTAVLVYREGLECILVLSAVVAGLIRTQRVYWKPIAGGAGIGFLATILTWFILVGILSLAATTTSENNIQAATGLLAIVVLLVVMNWFFHRIYWTGWISFQNRKKTELIHSVETADIGQFEAVKSAAYKGLILLGFVFEIMVGEQVNEMQLANWIPTHTFPVNIPNWVGTWFSVFNNWETIIAQIIAGLFVIGSFYAARMERFKPHIASTPPATEKEYA